MTPEQITIVVSIGLVVAGWVFTVWHKNRDTTNRAATVASTRNSERLDVLEKQFAALDIKITPMWAKVQRQISEDLHMPHRRFKEMDALLEKLDNGTIDDYQGDKARLLELLIKRSKDMGPEVTDSQRASAAIMATVMEKASAESNLAPEELINVEATGESPKDES